MALLDKNWDPRKGYGLTLTSNKYQGFNKTDRTALKKIELFKLHGSFNWFVKQNKKEDLLILFSKKPNTILNPKNLRLSEKSGYLRQIIPPIHGKFFSHNFWRSIWLKSFKQLIASDQIIIIGCSLVETDFHIRTFFSRAKMVKKKNREAFKSVLVADPDPQGRPQKRFKQIFRGSIGKFSSCKNFDELIKHCSRRN